MRKIKDIARLKAKFESSRITKEGLRRLLRSGVLGKVKGIIGPYVVRYQGDRPIISRRPLIYNASKTRASVLGRKNFTSEIRFARELNSMGILKELWKQSPVKGISPYHKMIFCNKMKNGLPSTENTITPPGNQLYYDNLCSLGADYSINISENAHSENNDRLIILLVPYDPVHKSSPSFETIKIEITPPSAENIELDQSIIEVLKKYKRFLIYSAVIRIDGNLILWSNTVCDRGRIFNERETFVILFVLVFYRLWNLYSKHQSPFLKNIRDG